MTNSSLEFTTAKRRNEPVPFVLDGVTYHFIPPKAAVMILPIADGSASTTSAYLDWLGEGLNDWDRLHGNPVVGGGGLGDPLDLAEGEDGPQVKAIYKRLRDKTDDLDVKDLVHIVDGLAEEVAGRPTT